MEQLETLRTVVRANPIATTESLSQVAEELQLLALHLGYLDTETKSLTSQLQETNHHVGEAVTDVSLTLSEASTRQQAQDKAIGHMISSVSNDAEVHMLEEQIMKLQSDLQVARTDLATSKMDYARTESQLQEALQVLSKLQPAALQMEAQLKELRARETMFIQQQRMTNEQQQRIGSLQSEVR